MTILMAWVLAQGEDGLPAEISEEKAWVTPQFTCLSFKFKLDRGVFVGVNMWESEIRSFKDDKDVLLGTHAVNEPTDKSSAAVFSLTGHSESGASATLMAKKKSEGSRVTAEGFLDIWLAEKLQEGEERVKLFKDSTFHIGPYDLTVDSIETTEKETRVKVKMIVKRKLPGSWLAQLKHFDGETEYKSVGGYSQTSEEKTDKGKQYVHLITWIYKKAPEDLVLKYKVYIDPVRWKVPFKASADIEPIK
jgi:hypothetical protein